MSKMSKLMAIIALSGVSYIANAADPYIRIPYTVINNVTVSDPKGPIFNVTYPYAGLTAQQGSKFMDATEPSIYVQGILFGSPATGNTRNGMMEIVSTDRFKTNGIIANVRMTDSY